MTNHVFTGWFADSACTQVWDFATLITADRTLYAGWEELPRYTVSFDSQGGSTVTNRTVYKGRPVSRPADPTWAHHAFAGWFSDANCTVLWDFSTPIQANRTLYAGWDAVVYRVVYHANGAAYGSAPVDGISYSYQATVTVAGNTGELLGQEVGGVHAGKGIHQRFLGWSTNSAATSAQYAPGATFAIKTDMALHAIYTGGTSVIGKIGPAGGYIVHYNPYWAWRYLEAAPTDLPGTHPWRGDNEYTVNGIMDGIGTEGGAENTLWIANVFGPGSYAAAMCTNYAVTNRGIRYDDWFLPSRQELNTMYNAMRGTPGLMDNKRYWSSYGATTYNESTSWESRLDPYLVRPLRMVGTWTFNTTPAVFSSGPTVTGTEKFTISFSYTVNKKAWVYCVALESGSPVPSAAQIREGKDASGNDVPWRCALSHEVSVVDSGSEKTDTFGNNFRDSSIRPGKTYDLYFVTETYGRLSTPVKITATTTALQSTYPSMYVRGDIFTDGTTAKSMTLVDDNLWALDVDEAQIKLGSFHFEVTGESSWGMYWGDNTTPDKIADASGEAIQLGTTYYYSILFNASNLEYELLMPGPTWH